MSLHLVGGLVRVQMTGGALVPDQLALDQTIVVVKMTQGVQVTWGSSVHLAQHLTLWGFHNLAVTFNLVFI